MRLPLRVGMLLAATTIAGCASDATEAGTFVSPGPTSPAASPSDPTPTAPTPTPSSLSRKQAAKRYLDIVRPYNEALEKLEKAINNGAPLARQRALAERTAEELRTEMRRLRATAWPPKVAGHVDDLVATSKKALKHWTEAADARTSEELFRAAVAAGEFSGSDTASKIRELLDLDSYDEGDYS